MKESVPNNLAPASSTSKIQKNLTKLSQNDLSKKPSKQNFEQTKYPDKGSMMGTKGFKSSDQHEYMEKMMMNFSPFKMNPADFDREKNLGISSFMPSFHEHAS